MTNATKLTPVAPADLSPKQRAERERNEREGGAEDESTDSDADPNVGMDDPTERGGSSEASAQDERSQLSPPTPAQGSTR